MTFALGSARPMLIWLNEDDWLHAREFGWLLALLKGIEVIQTSTTLCGGGHLKYITSSRKFINMPSK